MPRRNKEEDRKYDRERRNRKGYIRPHIRMITRRVNNLKESTPCADCGNSFTACCMDFDHVRGIKVDAVSQMVRRGDKWSIIEAEITKCDIRCANCHRIRTELRRLERKEQ